MDHPKLDPLEMAVVLDCDEEEEAMSRRETIIPGPPDEDFDDGRITDPYAYGTENERFLYVGPLEELERRARLEADDG